MVKKIAEKMNLNLNTVLMSAYVSFVWFAYLFAYYLKECASMGVFFGLVLMMAVVSFLVIPKVMKWVSQIKIPARDVLNTKQKVLHFLIYSLVIFGYMFIWYKAYYPGGFHADSLGQYMQVVEGWWHDWNPVWHTIFCFGLPIWLTHRLGAVIMFQIIYFALIIGFMAETIDEYAGSKWAAGSVAVIILNPFVCINAMIADKDVDFGLACMAVMICSVRMYLYNKKAHSENPEGEVKLWEDKVWKVLLMSFALGCSFLFRHNGPLFTLAIVIALFFIMNRKKWIIMTAVFMVMVAAIKGPLYNSLDAVKPGGRVTETVGLPLTIIANCVVENPELLDPEVKEFVYSIADQELWEICYVCGNFNEVKFREDFNMKVVDETGRGKVLKYMLSCIKNSPQASFRAAFRLTGLVYGIDGNTDDDYKVVIGENKFDIRYFGNAKLKNFFEIYNEFCRNSIFKYLCRYTGVTNLIMLVCILSRRKLNIREDWKKIGLCLPLFAYSYGTMLLLTAPDMRFFLVSFLMYPLIVFFMLYDEGLPILQSGKTGDFLENPTEVVVVTESDPV